MDKQEFIEQMSQKLKLIRAEKGITQPKMAGILGISKKTLTEIEKGRVLFNWCSAVTCAVIFEDSFIMERMLGNDVNESVKSIAEEEYGHFSKTYGVKVWWEDIEAVGEYRLQQNIISKHFRIIDSHDRRIASSFNKEYIKERLTFFTKRSKEFY